ncbi:helicase associated domain-containing protein [Streptomyces sp. NPDC004250]|uniref:helicase associated domain-containing protein n=1 Tax=Streptomyces sp. NPDC004250 TaxID=3364692 RepID=UPI00369D9009
MPGGDDHAVASEGWPASLAAFPFGQWIAGNRRTYARGDMDADRVEQLEKLGMVWSHCDVAWEEGLVASRGWAAEHGHLLAPLDASFQGYRVGIWLKSARAAARKAQEIEQRRAEGLPVDSSAGALSEARREQLEDIDPSWWPTWPVEWQRAFHLVRLHLDAGDPLPTSPGDVVHRGEERGRWVRSVRLGWDSLTRVQQWMCEQVLGIESAGEYEKPKPRRTQADKWTMNYQAAKQFYEREGHLLVPRNHVEQSVGDDQEEQGTQARSVDRQPGQPGRDADPGAGGAAVRHRDAAGVGDAESSARSPARTPHPGFRFSVAGQDLGVAQCVQCPAQVGFDGA